MRKNKFLAIGLLAGAACNPGAKPAEGADAGEPPADSQTLLAQVDKLAGPLKSAPKSFEVLTALGNLYYDNGRYLDAVDSMRQALEKGAPVEAADAALRAKGVQPAAELPLECRKTQSYGLEQIAAAAKKLEETDPAKALRCDDEELSAVLDARARRADALYLIGQPDVALAEHKKVLARAPDSPESLFFVGAITLEQSNGDKAKLEEGKGYWRRLLEGAPTHPRAALVKESLPKAEELFAPRKEQAGALPAGHPGIDGAEGEAGELPPGHPAMEGSGVAMNGAAHGMNGAPGSPQNPMAHDGPSAEQVANVADAVAQTERTPELEAGLDKLTADGEADLDAGRFQEARDKLVRVMPMRPNDARTAADLGAAMAGLGKNDMAERVLERALGMDPKQPRALYALGKLLAQKGDAAGAKEKLAALQTSDAKFAADHHVADELAKLKRPIDSHLGE